MGCEKLPAATPSAAPGAELHYIVGAAEYSDLQVKAGDAVEVELPDRAKRLQTFPRGTIRRGELVDVLEPRDEFEDIADKAKRAFEKINNTISGVDRPRSLRDDTNSCRLELFCATGVVQTATVVADRRPVGSFRVLS